jgi:hypothetical protein
MFNNLATLYGLLNRRKPVGGIDAGVSAFPSAFAPTMAIPSASTFSPTAATTAPTQVDPITHLLTTLLGGQQQNTTASTNVGDLLSKLYQAKDPVGYADKMSGIGMSNVPNNPYSPWQNGFFRTDTQRRQVEQDRYPSIVR